MLEDGLSALGCGGRAERQTKKRLCVIYTGAAGHEESGIDMGGLFKDFWTDLSALAFDVNYGLFRLGKEMNPRTLRHGEGVALLFFLSTTATVVSWPGVVMATPGKGGGGEGWRGGEKQGAQNTQLTRT